MLFGEAEFPARFEAAARAGFSAVEIQFPYAWDKKQLAQAAKRAAVEIVLINITAGDPQRGERGIACLPGRAAEFREGVARALEYAVALGCRRMNCLAGIAPRDSDPAELRETYVSNLRYAAGKLAREGVTLLVEPISTAAIPGFFLNRSAEAFALLDDVSNLKVQYDLYHMRMMGDDLAATIEANLSRIGHMQFADAPGRHQPGTGAIDFPALFHLADRLGYRGWMGAEYTPTGRTEESLAWAKDYL